jgi:phosphoribosyl 1,2-cyclic phosphodiesterase
LLIFRALASGSSGNAYLLRTQTVSLLFDAGLAMPRLEKYLLAEGIVPADLSAVLISHEHRDHCFSAGDLAKEHSVPVWANADVLRAIGLHGDPQSRLMDIDQPVLFGDVQVTCFPVQHDSVCPVGFLVHVAGRTVAIATDLGKPTPSVTDAVEIADLVVLEANHDTGMLNSGRYPYHLRRRVSGPEGHLSNTQAASILARHLRDERTEVWLAHLSKENNTPALAMSTVRGLLRSRGLDSLTIGIAQRDRPSLRWTGVPRPRQLSLFPSGHGAWQ